MTTTGAQAAFLRACALDVLVPKPGNVSVASPGHGMRAQQFIDSAQAAAGALFQHGRPVGERIERAVSATWAAAGCNTNLGIVLLCAPLAAALEALAPPVDAAGWRASVDRVLSRLNVVDAQAAFRAIVQANPGGLGRTGEGDVHEPPSIGLREAMALAAARDSIARQYALGFADVFQCAADVVASAVAAGAAPAWNAPADAPVDEAMRVAVQRLYLRMLARWPDSHIVRKHGGAVAQSVMAAAHGLQRDTTVPAPAALQAWDADLKQHGINPGTTADLTVAVLFVCGVLGVQALQWHGT